MTSPDDYIRARTPAFRRMNVALIAAAFSTFAVIYCVQPLLPVLAEAFHLSPAASSLALSTTSATLGLGMLVAGVISEAMGRKRVMLASLIAAAVLTLIAAFAPNWTTLLVVRTLAGIALSGVPAVAMAYVSEEVDPRSGGLAMGLYVGGTAFGGMVGRILSGVLADYVSWRAAIGAIGVLALISAALFGAMLPESRHFSPRSVAPRRVLAGMRMHLTERGLPWLFVVGFLVMGSFVSIYNYIGFRLVQSPYRLSHAAVSSIFAIYVIGMYSSAWAGQLAARRGSRNVLWLMVLVMLTGVAATLGHPLWMIVLGIAALTFGFFGAHTILSAWIGRRALEAKALASSLYLLFYYAGSSVMGTLTGELQGSVGWRGVAGAVGAALVVALAIAVALRRLQPLLPPETFHPEPG
jgi:YNFM family putative membrane transporter